ncbi:MAG: Trm112 family protein [Promethearchaeia archaeon]
MKPWLLDILACPMDKHFPLQLFIFSYETPEEEFKDFHKIYQKRDLDSIKSEKIINISKNEEDVLVKDLIVIKKTPVDKYLGKVRNSIDELANISDRSQSSFTEKCFQIALNEIKPNIKDFINRGELHKLDNILPELYFLNKLKIDVEIESGLLFCEQCNRWFPIIETIPQMLPDQYRDRKKELKFLKKKKNLLDKSFLQQELQPFGIK